MHATLPSVKRVAAASTSTTVVRFARAAALAALLLAPATASAQQPETLCDNQATDCRTPILKLIARETVGIDVGFWFMSDTRYATAIINRWKAGVPVRILMDPRANESKQLNDYTLGLFKTAGIPMRARGGSYILHWKGLLLHGQGLAEFSGANYQEGAFAPVTANVSWIDEMVFTTTEPAIYQTMACRFDDMWTNDARFYTYANIIGPVVRRAPAVPHAPEMNFPPDQDYGLRVASEIDKETVEADLIMFRFGDARPVDALIRALRRGVVVRVVAEPDEYRDKNYPWSAYNLDRLYAAGAQVKVRAHSGLTHEKALVLQGNGEVVFGSSNWTGASANGQDEHNFFVKGRPTIYFAFATQFETKWNNATGFVPFVPQPPSTPKMIGATVNGTSVTLSWDTGAYAYYSDIYFGTTASPALYLANVVGDPVYGHAESKTIAALAPGTYYWKIVGKTTANKTAASAVLSFTIAAPVQ